MSWTVLNIAGRFAGEKIMKRFPFRVATAFLVLLLGACTSVATRSEQYRLPGPYNLAFYETHTDAARSFYAAHWAHFGVYETALVHGEDDTHAFERLEDEVRELVVQPPRFEPAADLIAPQWVKIAYPTSRSMEWTHMLHEQLYDALTHPAVQDREAAGRRAIGYYLSNESAAFSTRGYGHRWMMSGGGWAGVFAEKYPALNGILWAYHWHHAAVYEALMEPTPEARERALDRVIRTFTDSVLVDPPETMPLTAEVAPRFSRMFPAAAQIFDNLHMMHDVANDVMVDERLSRDEKEAEIERMRRNMSYPAQETVVAPGMPMEGGGGMMDGGGHDAVSAGGVRVPTRLPDGSWLPQGHPDARSASMQELMRPLPPATERGEAEVEERDGGTDRPSGRAGPGGRGGRNRP